MDSVGRSRTPEPRATQGAVAEGSETPLLVLDLRNTPSGGNTEVARAIIGHFLTEARPYQMHEIPAVERRYGVPRRFVELALSRAPHFPGPVVVLAGRWTGSMGEGLLIGMHAAAGARTFASDMGNLLGAVHNLEVEVSGLQLDLGLEALFHVDGTPREHYVAEQPLPSADRDREGKDAALEAVRTWLASETSASGAGETSGSE